jgi:hypothetical protein
MNPTSIALGAKPGLRNDTSSAKLLSYITACRARKMQQSNRETIIGLLRRDISNFYHQIESN